MSFLSSFSDELEKLGRCINKQEKARFGSKLDAKTRFALSRGGKLKKEGFAKDVASSALKAVANPVKELWRLRKSDPQRYERIVRQMKSDPTSQVARGAGYGIAGYRGLKGLGHRHKETGKREPLTGVLRGAASGMALTLPLLLAAKHRALRHALTRSSKRVRS